MVLAPFLYRAFSTCLDFPHFQAAIVDGSTRESHKICFFNHRPDDRHWVAKSTQHLSQFQAATGQQSVLLYSYNIPFYLLERERSQCFIHHQTNRILVLSFTFLTLLTTCAIKSSVKRYNWHFFPSQKREMIITLTINKNFR